MSRFAAITHFGHISDRRLCQRPPTALTEVSDGNVTRHPSSEQSRRLSRSRNFHFFPQHPFLNASRISLTFVLPAHLSSPSRLLFFSPVPPLLDLPVRCSLHLQWSCIHVERTHRDHSKDSPLVSIIYNEITAFRNTWRNYYVRTRPAKNTPKQEAYVVAQKFRECGRSIEIQPALLT